MKELNTVIVRTGRCRKCGETVKVACREKNLQELVRRLLDMEGFECPGHHVELCSPYPHYWNVDGNDWKWEETYIPTEEEFIADLEAKGYEVRDTAGMGGLITGFALGFPMTNDGRLWDFTHSPKGKRWYYATKKEN